MFKVLLLEDDRELNRSMCFFLRQNGYDAVGSFNAAEAYDAVYSTTFDLVIADIMLPGIDGFEFAENVRTTNKEIPIMFVTARDDFMSKQRGFKAGIDDYMVKPVDLPEMLLHIEALLRRAKITSSKRLKVGSLVMDADAYSAYINGEDVGLSVKEFNILYKLLSYPGKTFTRSQLMDEFWSTDCASTPRTVDVYITKIRDKTLACTDFDLNTVRGLGYKAVLKV